ncbi:heavy-metal-associated domain-containing protein [Nakamurella multipartita]|jgi:copper chaperone CopZ|uniref:Heavy metal transport/detoxification protein n=1 Tax=Nakamurella multipartita (strain ATCC 700099 / DSM 44233 / CIP 104796 / JCM 9543 / NBRC 105858 / Y-104) TaxID=479431 RepID=C8XIW2_NAKMY|nr:heavy-metal-associated domain-containing protein [Nakamurella multipartita]ACV76549.1 Heavy metal transport/detoxification protein [Nakamurella multipartita DSM 44233]HOZ56926.1 heavy-metal-associated domain-containing protein [Nakamurella multipartita]
MSENTARYRVTGMTCDQCVVAVTEEVRRLEGVRSVDIELRPGDISVVTIVSDAPLLAGAVRDAIDEAGYALAS